LAQAAEIFIEAINNVNGNPEHFVDHAEVVSTTLKFSLQNHIFVSHSVQKCLALPGSKVLDHSGRFQKKIPTHHGQKCESGNLRP
jgi:hypothetical protein